MNTRAPRDGESRLLLGTAALVAVRMNAPHVEDSIASSCAPEALALNIENCMTDPHAHARRRGVVAVNFTSTPDSLPNELARRRAAGLADSEQIKSV